MDKILLTGGAGFIGSHICLSLLENGSKVVVLDSFVNSSKNVFKKVFDICHLNNIWLDDNLKVYEGDIRDKLIIEKIFNDAKLSGSQINSVIHLAGLKSLDESIKNPYNYWDVNVRGSLNLVEVMSKFSCNILVFSSSAMIYSPLNLNNIKETDEIKPPNPYSNTKFVIEKFLEDTYKSSEKKWSIVNLRYFNPIGAHSSGLLGDNPLGINRNLFPTILDVASKKKEKLKIYGDDWPTADGTGVRDFIHIKDLAEGHLIALKYLYKENPQFISFNIGTGKGTSVLELVKTFERVNRVEVPFEMCPRRKGDVPKLVANNHFAKKILNWSPNENLERMCIDGWKWKLLN